MKKIFAFLAFASVALFGLQSCDKDDQAVDPNKLPTTAQTFINTHFADATVSSVVKEYDDLTYHYEVYLSDGTHLEFKKNGEWKSVENRTSGVPKSVIPTKILDYIATNYSDCFVIDIERDRQYDVELNNDLDLDFNLDGDFIRIDR